MSSEGVEDMLLREKATTEGGCVATVAESGVVNHGAVRRNTFYVGKAVFGAERLIQHIDENERILGVSRYSEIQSYIEGEQYEPKRLESQVCTLLKQIEDPKPEDSGNTTYEFNPKPKLVLNVETKFSDDWTVVLSFDNLHNPTSAVESIKKGSTITLNLGDDSTVDISENEIPCDVLREDDNLVARMLREEKFQSLLRAARISEYDNWFEIEVDEMSMLEDSESFRISATNLDISWTVENPNGWSEDEEAVMLTENFAHGNPELLDSVLATPRCLFDQLQEQPNHLLSDGDSWVLALEPPSSSEVSESLLSRLNPL